MAGLGIGIAWVGYWVLYYGVTQIQGGNWGFFDLGVPSRWATHALTPRDDGSTLSGKATTNATAGKGKPLTVSPNPFGGVSAGGVGIGYPTINGIPVLPFPGPTLPPIKIGPITIRP